MNLTKTDIRFLEWLSGYLFGTEVGKVSPTIAKLSRHGIIWRSGKKVAMTGVAWHALIQSGFEPQREDSMTLREICSK